jgi:hypothetical protein
MAKPTEIRKLATLLEQDADSAEDMAKKAWDLVEEMIALREQYVVVVTHPSLNIIQCVGPYATENQLRKDYGKRIHAYDSNSRACIAKLRYPDTINLD